MQCGAHGFAFTTPLSALRSFKVCISPFSSFPRGRGAPNPLRQSLGALSRAPSCHKSAPLSRISNLRSFWRGKEHTQRSTLPPSDEESARDQILEKALKGRLSSAQNLLMRCTVLDASGNVSQTSGEFKKSDLSTQHSLHPRDLRKIDSRIPNLVPTILVRKESFLVNILHIRGLVKADTVILFDTYGSTDSRLHSVFLYHLEHNLKSKGSGLPYEFRALESILLSVSSALEAEVALIRHLVGGLLSELEDDIDRDKFKRLLRYSRRLSNFQSRAKLVQHAIEEVLEQDEDLAAMYLTDKKRSIPRGLNEHEDLEVLLESFAKQVEEIVNESDNMISNVQSTQEIVELILDSNRNALLSLDLKISIITMGLGAGALGVGAFGMNLQNHWEDDGVAFAAVTGAIVGFTVIVIVMGLRTLSKIRRVGLGSAQANSIAFPRRQMGMLARLRQKAHGPGGNWLI